MDAIERRSALLASLQGTGRVEVAEAARRFGTAEMTIRRDLDSLVAHGAARKVRGGAVSLLLRAEEPPFPVCAVAAGDAKRRMGRVAADLLVDGESVVLDSGTTALEVARSLGGRRVTVMPLSLHAASVLAQIDGVRLLMPGGEVRSGELLFRGSAGHDKPRHAALRHSGSGLLRPRRWSGDGARSGGCRGKAGDASIGLSDGAGGRQHQVRPISDCGGLRRR